MSVMGLWLAMHDRMDLWEGPSRRSIAEGGEGARELDQGVALVMKWWR